MPQVPGPGLCPHPPRLRRLPPPPPPPRALQGPAPLPLPVLLQSKAPLARLGRGKGERGLARHRRQPPAPPPPPTPPPSTPTSPSPSAPGAPAPTASAPSPPASTQLELPRSQSPPAAPLQGPCLGSGHLTTKAHQISARRRPAENAPCGRERRDPTTMHRIYRPNAMLPLAWHSLQVVSINRTLNHAMAYHDVSCSDSA